MGPHWNNRLVAGDELIDIAAAREIVLAAVRPLPSERVPLADALGRVLAEDVAAAEDLPEGAVVLGCDSVLELGGQVHGSPPTPTRPGPGGGR